MKRVICLGFIFLLNVGSAQDSRQSVEPLGRAMLFESVVMNNPSLAMSEKTLASMFETVTWTRDYPTFVKFIGTYRKIFTDVQKERYQKISLALSELDLTKDNYFELKKWFDLEFKWFKKNNVVFASEFVLFVDFFNKHKLKVLDEGLVEMFHQKSLTLGLEPKHRSAYALLYLSAKENLKYPEPAQVEAWIRLVLKEGSREYFSANATDKTKLASQRRERLKFYFDMYPGHLSDAFLTQLLHETIRYGDVELTKLCMQAGASIQKSTLDLANAFKVFETHASGSRKNYYQTMFDFLVAHVREKNPAPSVTSKIKINHYDPYGEKVPTVQVFEEAKKRVQLNATALEANQAVYEALTYKEKELKNPYTWPLVLECALEDRMIKLQDALKNPNVSFNLNHTIEGLTLLQWAIRGGVAQEVRLILETLEQKKSLLNVTYKEVLLAQECHDDVLKLDHPQVKQKALETQKIFKMVNEKFLKDREDSNVNYHLSVVRNEKKGIHYRWLGQWHRLKQVGLETLSDPTFNAFFETFEKSFKEYLDPDLAVRATVMSLETIDGVNPSELAPMKRDLSYKNTEPLGKIVFANGAFERFWLENSKQKNPRR